jgi:uncharacterized protein (TIGR00290 family)
MCSPRRVVGTLSAVRILLSWSSGKDSAFALATLRQREDAAVVALMTTVNAAAARVAMHAVRQELLELQADAVGVPLWTLEIPSPCPHDVYEATMARAIERALGEGITHVAYGDLFLREVRAYREAQLVGTGITPLFPLWGRDTRVLADDMIASGTRAIVTCVDPQQIDGAYSGRKFDAELLADLPRRCDPCGERGEFHTFAWDGPAFDHPVPVRMGATVARDGFVFTDLLPD